MNRLKKIFQALSDLGIVPPSQAIREAWATLDAGADFTKTPALASAHKLIDRIVGAVIGIAEDADKKGEA